MTTTNGPQHRTKNQVAHPTAPRARDLAAVALLTLATLGLNAAAYTTDPRLGLAATSLTALAGAAALGYAHEQQ
ncbi:hypothetical protein LN042_19710 [Kitasatospora sp. RB6PN24]|uniref:hypothetical protein n=1 Tax=Kitasatospora humi TaxID=2893891 RepID=UPI001E312898|nr:hypothetical protein [Kitasatospora humi]MCC9309285.1 hypothetical protein [Kitasatospora humi]